MAEPNALETLSLLATSLEAVVPALKEYMATTEPIVKAVEDAGIVNVGELAGFVEAVGNMPLVCDYILHHGHDEPCDKCTSCKLIDSLARLTAPASTEKPIHSTEGSTTNGEEPGSDDQG